MCDSSYSMKKDFIISNKMLCFYFPVMIYKIVLEYGYYILSTEYDDSLYPIQLNIFKYIYGLAWIGVLYIGLNNDSLRTSTFLLQGIYFFQIIPITVVFSLKNENLIFYSIICLGMLICEILVWKVRTVDIPRIRFGLNYWYILFALLITAYLVYRYMRNGMPSLTALNIYSVYDMRKDSAYTIGKYWGYLQKIIACVVIPVFLTACVWKRKWILTVATLCVELAVYLYTGQKTYLFAGVVVIISIFFAETKHFPVNFWSLFISGIAVCSLGAKIGHIRQIFSLIVRRVLVEPANIKFLYFDFFTKNPKEGFAGIFPRWLINIPSHYTDVNYTNLIGATYYDSLEMHCDTGFIAEGFLRWGYPGILVEFLLLALLLKIIDDFSERTGSVYAIGCSIYFIYSLTEMHLIDEILFGALAVLTGFYITYSKAQIEIKMKYYDGKAEQINERI